MFFKIFVLISENKSALNKVYINKRLISHIQIIYQDIQ